MTLVRVQVHCWLAFKLKLVSPRYASCLRANLVVILP